MSAPILHSEQYGALHLGKLPASSLNASHALWADLRKPLKAQGLLPKIPKVFGHGDDFSDWLMLGNGPCDDNSVNPEWAAAQGAGNCAWAWPGHVFMEAAHDAGRPIPLFTCLNILEQYSVYSGYNLQTGADDNGSDLQQVITWLQDKGLTDENGTAYKIGPSVALTPGNLEELWECVYIFENVDPGWQLQQAQEDQFNSANPVWDYVAGSTVIGGHNAGAVGHPGDGNGRLVTWARAIQFTPVFYEHLNDESFAWPTLEECNAVTGEDAEHASYVDLEKYVTLIAQQKSAIFQAQAA